MIRAMNKYVGEASIPAIWAQTVERKGVERLLPYNVGGCRFSDEPLIFASSPNFFSKFLSVVRAGPKRKVANPIAIN